MSSLSRGLLSSTALVSAGFALLSGTVLALPQNGVVAGGSATITQSSATQLDITQGSDRAVIDWHSFSIGSGETTTFHQPGAESVAVNRVTGVDPSQIMGSLNANGRVVLVNPNGILFDQGARVNVGGLVASTNGITTANAMAGNYVFDQAGRAGASIVNKGTITVAQGGLAALVAPSVVNSGVITANLGKVSLASGNSWTLDLYGDHLVNFALNDKVAQQVVGAEDVGVTNSGKIAVGAGRVELTANVAKNVVNNAINMSGIVEASSVTTKGGVIILDGGDNGVAVSGTLDASGATGGGTIQIGSWTGASVSVTSSAILDASAKTSGNGGQISVISQDTNFAGTALAKGGATGGDGGNIETSGYQLNFDGASVSTTAAFGKTGNWLLDPYDVTINSAGASAIVSALGSSNVTVQTTASNTGTSSYGSVVNSGSGDITVANAISYNSANTLTLSAYRNISVTAGITNSGAGTISLHADNTGTGTGTVSFTGGNKITVGNNGIAEIYYNPSSYTSPTSFTGNVTLGSNATLNAYMLVNTLTQLQAISTNLSANYALGRDIDASATSSWNGGAGFVPLGDGNSTFFRGIFDGQDHTITNLTIYQPGGSFVGLFGDLTGTLHNVGLVGGSITGNSNVGSLIGYMGDQASTPSLYNVYSSASVTITDYGYNGGGLIGVNDGGYIQNSHNTGTITGGNYTSNIGGIDGWTWESFGLYRCYNTGNITTGIFSNNIGGLVGDNADGIIQAYNTGNISVGHDSSAIGGIAGYNIDYPITQLYNTGSITAGANSSAIAGIVGSNDGGNVFEVYNAGPITVGSGSGYVDPIAGNNDGYNGSSYWDSQTSLQTSAYDTGLTTAQLKSGLPSGFDNTVWTIQAGVTYPYFGWQPAPAASGTYVVTVTVNSGQGKTYGGLDSAFTYTASGFQGGDTASSIFTGSLGRVSGETVGTYAINLGSLASNTTEYTISYIGGNFVITPASLTVTATPGQNKVYGANDPTTYAYTTSGLTNSDTTASLNGALARTAGNNVGTYAIGQGTLADTNYSITYVAANFSITPASLTVTATPGQNKVYGANDPTAYAYTTSGLTNSDTTASLNGALSRSTGETVNTYAIGQGTLADTNYTITYVSANFSITPASLTVTATAGQNKVYGANDPTAYAYTTSGLTNSDTTASLNGALSRTAGSNVGTYAIGQGTLADTNYTITYIAANFSITPASLTVTATAGQNKVYGANDPTAYAYTTSGLTNSDTTASLNGALARTTGETVNTYAIGQGTLADTNYTITYVAANFSITPASLTVTATPGQNKVYGANDPTAYAYTTSGLTNSDTTASLNGALTRATGETVNTYAIGQGTLADTNYTITYVSANFSITPASLTVTATPGQNKVYGANDPTAYAYTTSGLTNSDTTASLNGALTRATGETVNTYAIGQGTLADTNYTITYVGANFSITPASLTVTATAGQNKVYGANDPTAYAYTTSGLTNSDTTASLNGALARTTGETINTYAIGQGTLADTNYTITYVAANFSITPASLTVTASAGQNKVYGANDPTAYAYTTSGLTNSDTTASLNGALSRSTGETVNTYAIGQGTLADTNYTITYVAANFSITPASLTVTATPGQNKVYGANDPTAYAYTTSGLTNSDTTASLNGALSRTAGSNVGTYAIGQGTLADTNYTITYVSANFSITPASLTVTATPGQNKVYGANDPTAYAYTTSGLTNSDTTTSVLSGALTRITGETIGTYAINQGSLALLSSNYILGYVGGIFEITSGIIVPPPPPVIITSTPPVSIVSPGKTTSDPSDFMANNNIPNQVMSQKTPPQTTQASDTTLQNKSALESLIFVPFNDRSVDAATTQILCLMNDKNKKHTDVELNEATCTAPVVILNQDGN